MERSREARMARRRGGIHPFRSCPEGGKCLSVSFIKCVLLHLCLSFNSPAVQWVISFHHKFLDSAQVTSSSFAPEPGYFIPQEDIFMSILSGCFP